MATAAVDSFAVKLRTMSGEVREIAGLRPEDHFSLLMEKVAQDLKLLTCELRLCQGLRPFTAQEQAKYLKDLGICSGFDLTCVRIPRITTELLQGMWINSKGAKINVEEKRATFSGMVSYPVVTDEDGTVIGIGDRLSVKALGGPEIITFDEDTWWRIRDDDSEFAVIVRTVGGVCRRIEGFKSVDSLSSLRLRAYDELKDEMDTPLLMRIWWGDYSYTAEDEKKTLRNLGIGDGTTLLCVK